jgi:UTP--glucose-1-phosphate uridylyltransferase
VQIKKAVITAAGRGGRLYPVADTVQKAMLPIVDRDGLAKPVIQIIAEEALDSGIDEIGIVCAPGDEARYLQQFRLLRENLLYAYEGVDWAQEQARRLDNLVRRLCFAVQPEPLGYGHAVSCAKTFVGTEPFLLLLSDHLYISNIEGQRCAQQLIALAVREACAVAAVQATREHLVGHYGTLSGKRVPQAPGVYQIERILEKPALSTAELQLQTPGLRAGHFLCFFGMHVLTHGIFEILETMFAQWSKSEGGLQLTPALQELAAREKYLALDVAGSRYDIGARFGLMQAQIALGVAGKDRDEIHRVIIEILAEAHQRRPPRAGD